MALYLCGEKVKIALGHAPCRLNLVSTPTCVFLVSADGFILKDCNGVFLTAKESD